MIYKGNIVDGHDQAPVQGYCKVIRRDKQLVYRS